MPLMTTYIEHKCPKCGKLNDGYKEWQEGTNEPEWTSKICECGHEYEFSIDGDVRA